MQRDVRGILSRLPKTLDETYERILRDIHEDNKEHARRLLHCLAIAIRPLHVEELAEILAFDFDAVEGGIPEYHADWRWKDQGEAVLSTCSSLITIAEYLGQDDDYSYSSMRVVQFSHFSVKELLMSNRLATPTRYVSRYHILPEPAHTILAQACLGSLHCLRAPIDPSKVNDFPLAIYAAKHWVAHAQFQDVASHVKCGIRDLFDPDKPYFSSWIGTYDVDGNSRGFPKPTPLYYSALCGFHDIAEHLAIKYPQHVNAIVGRYASPLAAALSGGHVRVAELLLNHGANVDNNGRGQTPLHVLLQSRIYVNHKDSPAGVRLLLERGADVNARDELHQSPLYMLLQRFGWARGHDLDDQIFVFIRLLQDYGADANALDGDDYSTLFLAIRSRMPSNVVRILLENGADPNLRNGMNQTPLHVLLGPQGFLPRYHGSDYNLVVAQLLLERGANVNARDNNYKTPLLLALERQAFDMTRFLLEQGANPNMENSEGDTPLHTLLLQRNNKSENDVPIVHLLMEHGADMGARNKDQANPLDLAPYYGKVLIAQVLLDHADRLEGEDYSRQGSCSATHFSIDLDVGVNAQDKDHAARLRLACYCGRLDTVQALLSHGAIADSENFRGENPLHLLSRGKHNSQEDDACIARALVVRGVDVNAQGKSHRTPLHLASCFGGPAIAKVLVEHGAQANAVDDRGETPLHLLSRSRHHSQEEGVGIARLLLEYGADVNARDMRHRIPLHHASYNGMLAIAQVLLRHGGNPNAKDRHGETSLHLVLQSKYVSEEHGITRLLLEHGADIDAQDNDDVTPLDLSYRFWKHKIFNILLEHSANVFLYLGHVNVDTHLYRENKGKITQGRFLPRSS